MTSPAEKLLASKRPLIIGHRGYCSIAPENTLPSFKLALEARPDLIELDYHHSKDGVPVVIHDHILDRTTDARKKWRRRRIKVSQTTAADIQTLDAGSWFGTDFVGTGVSLLSEALDFICGNGSIALIEHKSGDAATLAKLLQEKNLINKVILISFNWKFLREFHELEPKQILGALGPPARLSNGRRPTHMRRRLAARLNDLLKTGAKLAVWNRRVTFKSVLKARDEGIQTWVYTVNEKKESLRLQSLGVTGIITDKIAAIRSP